MSDISIANGTGTNVKVGFRTFTEAYNVALEYANEHGETWFVYEHGGNQTSVHPTGTRFHVIHDAGGEGKVISRHRTFETARSKREKLNRRASANVYAVRKVYP